MQPHLQLGSDGSSGTLGTLTPSAYKKIFALIPRLDRMQAMFFDIGVGEGAVLFHALAYEYTCARGIEYGGNLKQVFNLYLGLLEKRNILSDVRSKTTVRWKTDAAIYDSYGSVYRQRTAEHVHAFCFSQAFDIEDAKMIIQHMNSLRPQYLILCETHKRLNKLKSILRNYEQVLFSDGDSTFYTPMSGSSHQTLITVWRSSVPPSVPASVPAPAADPPAPPDYRSLDWYPGTTLTPALAPSTTCRRSSRERRSAQGNLIPDVNLKGIYNRLTSTTYKNVVESVKSKCEVTATRKFDPDVKRSVNVGRWNRLQLGVWAKPGRGGESVGECVLATEDIKNPSTRKRLLLFRGVGTYHPSNCVGTGDKAVMSSRAVPAGKWLAYQTNETLIVRIYIRIYI